MDLPAAVLVTLIPTVSINLVSILSERHWREALRAFWPIPTFTVVGSFLGTQVLLSVDTEPLHLLIYLAGVIGFWKMKRWLHPWAALYSLQVAIGMLVWNLLDEQGRGLAGGVVSALPFLLLVVILWRSKSRFGG